MRRGSPASSAALRRPDRLASPPPSQPAPSTQPPVAAGSRLLAALAARASCCSEQVARRDRVHGVLQDDARGHRHDQVVVDPQRERRRVDLRGVQALSPSPRDGRAGAGGTGGRAPAAAGWGHRAPPRRRRGRRTARAPCGASRRGTPGWPSRGAPLWSLRRARAGPSVRQVNGCGGGVGGLARPTHVRRRRSAR